MLSLTDALKGFLIGLDNFCFELPTRSIEAGEI